MQSLKVMVTFKVKVDAEPVQQHDMIVSVAVDKKSTHGLKSEHETDPILNKRSHSTCQILDVLRRAAYQEKLLSRL
jgi:hypothetical protein